MKTLCTTCFNPPASPFRVYDERGKVALGCISAAHGGQLVSGTESARWHNRPEARKQRAAVRKAGLSPTMSVE